MAKRRKNKWRVSDLIEAYGLNAVKDAARFINKNAENLRKSAIENIDRLKIGDDTEYYETLGKRKLKDGSVKEYRVKRRYRSTGRLKDSTKVGLIDVDSITLKSKYVKGTVGNNAKDEKGRYYGFYIEYGRNPKPFFYKAFYERREKIRTALVKVLQNGWARGKK